ncbi:MAG: VCBS repeat-containing protein, partial [Spirochaetales bacterium]|nr:VCBS repeat-containing protein [Spirochaetales bacterium]
MIFIKKPLPAVLFMTIFLCTGFLLNSQQAMPDGSFTYFYPLKIPAGINGMQPQPALSYHSSGRNGMLGMGWSLSGIPAIARDASYAITFTDEQPGGDHFFYAGQRLILKEGTTDEYYTEKESFLKIVAVYAGDTISYWEIKDRSGKSMYFGYCSPEHHTTATDGHVDAVGEGGKALVWSLSKGEDTSGNCYYIQYHEDAEDGDYYPVNITYTKNSSHPLPVACTVEFFYETRTDHVIKFLPTRIDSDKRLVWISVKTDGHLTGKYGIEYEEAASTKRSRMTGITEYGNDGNSPEYNPAEFPCISPDYIPTGNMLPGIDLKWQDGGSGEIQPYTDRKEDFHPAFDLVGVWGLPDHCAGYTGDFTGDGVNDLLFWKKDSGKVYLYPVKNGKIQPRSDYKDSFHEDSDIYPGDYNGDGTTDLFFWKKSDGRINIHPVINGKIQGQSDYYASLHEDSLIYPGDYDADGTTDILFWKLFTGDVYIHPIINGEIQPQSDYKENLHPLFKMIVEFGWFTGHVDKFAGYTGDFTGDGTNDLFFWNNETGEIYLHPVKNGVIQPYSDHKTSFHEDSIIYPGDFNADGTADVLFWKINDGRVNLHLVKNGKIKMESDYKESFHEDSVIYPGDYNGDGTTDLFFWRDSSGGRVNLDPVINGKIQPHSDYRIDFHDASILYMGDFTGDGIQDVLFHHPLSGKLYIHPVSANYPDLLTSIGTAAGGTVNVEYSPATQVPGAVKPGETTRPYSANKSPRQLVTSITVNDGFGNDAVTCYDYSNGMYCTGYPDERRNIGFEWIKTTNQANGSYIKTEYYHKNDDALLQGMVKRQ